MSGKQTHNQNAGTNHSCTMFSISPDASDPKEDIYIEGFLLHLTSMLCIYILLFIHWKKSAFFTFLFQIQCSGTKFSIQVEAAQHFNFQCEW